MSDYDIANRLYEWEPFIMEGRNIFGGEKLVGNTTTPEAIGGDVACTSVIIQAKVDNTQNVKIGVSDGQYFELEAGKAIRINTKNLNLIYVNVEVNDEGINYIAEY